MFLDEREDTINDGWFWVDIAGYGTGTGYNIIDWPASYHTKSTAFSFADGHVELHRWTNPLTYPQIGALVGAGMSTNADLAWLQEHSTSN